jgi:hypothetical protein
MDDDEIGALWREYREDQQVRRLARCPTRIAEVRHGLPEGFRMEVVNEGYALRLTGPRDFLLVYYPIHERVQYRGQWRTMRASTVAKLMAEVARGARRRE